MKVANATFMLKTLLLFSRRVLRQEMSSFFVVGVIILNNIDWCGNPLTHHMHISQS
jgi:hypothetical protein